MTDIAITVEEDPVPIVCIMAARLKRSASHPQFTKLVRGMKGKFALSSHADPQAVTFVLDGKSVFLKRGIDKSARLVIKANLASGKPVKIKGLWRHPWLAMQASKLLDGFDADWTEHTNVFWLRARDYAGMPACIVLNCDDGRSLTLGTPGAAEPVLIEGSPSALKDLLTGGEIFMVAMMQGKLKALCSLEQATVLSEVTKDLMLGKT